MSTTESFGLEDALDVYFKNREAIIHLWSFYLTVTLAVLGYTVGRGKDAIWSSTSWILQWGYAGFSIANGFVLVCSQIELRRMACGVRRLADAQEAEEFAVYPMSPCLFVIFHVVVTVATIVAMRAATRRRDSEGIPVPSGHS